MLKRIIDKVTKDIHLLELVKGGGISLLFKIIGILIGYVFTIIVTRNLGAEVWGIFSLSYTLILIVSILGRLGFDVSLIKFIAQYNINKRNDLIKEVYLKTILLSFTFSLFFSIVLYWKAGWIADFIFQKKYLTPHFQISALGILPIVLVFINSACLRGIKSIMAFSFLMDLSKFFFAILFFLSLFLFFNNSYLPIIAFVSGAVITAAMSTFLWLKRSKILLISASSEVNLKNILKISLPMMFTSSMIFLLWWTDTLMLGIFGTNEEVGIYNIAIRIATLVSFPVIAIGNIAGPKFAESFAKNEFIELRKIAHQSTKLAVLSAIPLCLIIFLFSKLILNAFGEEFISGTVVLFILTISQLVNATISMNGLLLNMTGKQNKVVIILLISVCINIVLNYFLIPAFGIEGAAVSSFTGMLFKNLLCEYYVKKYYHFYSFSFRHIFHFKFKEQNLI